MGEPRSDQTILAAARQIESPAGRAAYLADACAGDPAQRRRVEELLRVEAEAAAPHAPAARPTVKLTFSNLAHTGETPGAKIGRYKLLRQIGEGGCGTVFLAEQEEPVRRRVALKVIKLGMDTKQVIARFEAERQALAMMDHPNIAKVLDAGATDSGRPFFVMEFVQGIPITRYCDEQCLDTEERLRIFMEVCSAVQHAHQKGIVHRDIKPSNILVTKRGDRAWPTVIDFGIAKATQGRLTESTLFTAYEQFIGTPAYMSPEQAGLSGLDVDTRSDIYSLGVLLYELLTGRPPFDPHSLHIAGVDEIRRIIREVEPPRPSTQLATLKGAALTTMAENRRVDPHRLALMLRGDLDWIVMKALEKDRDRRYESANLLAADLERFLRHEAVSAVAPSAAYQLRKFVRRHRGSVAAVAAIALLLIGGITATTWLAVLATRAKNMAAREAVRSAEVARFLKDMLESVGPARARGRDTAMLREILDTAARRVGTDLTNQPEVEFELSTTVGRTYRAAGSLADAERLLRSALELATRLYGTSHTNLVVVQEELGWTLREQGRLSEATNLFGQALTLSRALVGDDSTLAAGPMHRLGAVYADLGQFAEAEPLLIRSADILRRKLGPGQLPTLYARQNLASLYFREQKLAEMEPVAVEALADARKNLRDEHPLTLTLKVLLALLRQEQGRFEEAEKLHDDVLATKRRILGPEHPNTLSSMDNLAVVYAYEGRFSEAESLARSALDTHAKRGTSEARDAIALLANHAEYLRNLGRHAEAEAEFRRAITAENRNGSETDPFLLESRNGLALLCEFAGRRDEAEALVRDVVRLRRTSLPTDDLTLADSVAHLARLLLERGQAFEAEPLARESLAAFEAQRPDDWRRFASLSLVGGCRLAAGDTAAAETLLRQGYDGLKSRASRIPAIDEGCVRDTLDRLASLGEKLARPEDIARWREELERFDRSPAGQRLRLARTVSDAR